MLSGVSSSITPAAAVIRPSTRYCAEAYCIFAYVTPVVVDDDDAKSPVAIVPSAIIVDVTVPVSPLPISVPAKVGKVIDTVPPWARVVLPTLKEPLAVLTVPFKVIVGVVPVVVPIVIVVVDPAPPAVPILIAFVPDDAAAVAIL